MKQFLSKKTRLSAFWTFLLWLGISVFILVFCVALQPGAVTNTLRNFLHEPRLILLNLFPILALTGILTALLGNVFWAGSLAALFFHLLSLANLIKVECRKDPLVPADFSLLKEAMADNPEYADDIFYIIASGGKRDLAYDGTVAIANAMLADEQFSFGTDPQENNFFVCISKDLHQTLKGRFLLYNALLEVLFR